MEKAGDLLRTVLGSVAAKEQQAPKTAPESSIPQKSTQVDKTYAKPRRYPRRNPSDLLAVKGILSHALKKSGLDKKVERYGFILRWDEIVGEKFAGVTSPECIKGTRLIVRVKNSAWAQELAFCKNLILERLEPHLAPNEDVRDIIFFVDGG